MHNAVTYIPDVTDVVHEVSTKSDPKIPELPATHNALTYIPDVKDVLQEVWTKLLPKTDAEPATQIVLLFQNNNLVR